MVRKLKSQKKNNENKIVTLPKLNMKEILERNNIINKQINKALELVEKNLGTLYAKKMNYLTLNTARQDFLDRAVIILKKIYVEYVTKKTIHTNEIENYEYIDEPRRKLVIDLIKIYEETYLPKAVTMYYLTLFNINKMIEKYFNVNYYKKRFSEKEKTIYHISEYKNISSNVKTKMLEKTDIAFTGEWSIQIEKISKDLDYILSILNGYRERFIPIKNINKEFKRIKDGIEFKFNNEYKISKKEIKLLNKVFKNNPEIIESYKLPTHERYKTEFNFLIECMTYMEICYNKDNFKKLEISLLDVSGSKQKTKIILTQMKQVIDNLYIFLKNFEDLVDTGNDNFNTTIKKTKVI